MNKGVHSAAGPGTPNPDISYCGSAATKGIKQLVTEDTEARQEVTGNTAGVEKASLCSGTKSSDNKPPSPRFLRLGLAATVALLAGTVPEVSAQGMDAIKADMQLNEAPLHSSAPTGPGWTRGAGIGMGGAARGDATPSWWTPANTAFKSPTPWNSIVPWFVIYPGAANAATNVRVKISGIALYVLKKSTNTWEKIDTNTGNPTWASNYDFRLNSTANLGPAIPRTEPDGKRSYKLTAESNPIHGGVTNRAIDGADVAAVYAQVTTELILDDPNGPDDRASAQILTQVGIDYRPTTTIQVGDFAPMTYVPDSAFSRFGLVSAAPRIHHVASIDPPGGANTGSIYVQNGGVVTIPVAQFEANPPPSLSFREATSISIGAEDGWVLESTEASEVGGSNQAVDTGTLALRAGDSATRQQFKSILSFDTSALPANAVILGATLELRRGGSSGTMSDIGLLGALQADIRTGNFGSRPLLDNEDFEAAPTAANVVPDFNIPATDGEWAVGSLNAASLNAINHSGMEARTQFCVYFANGDNGNTTQDYLGFYSGENADFASRPVLWTSYKLNSPSLVSITSPAEGASLPLAPTSISATASDSDGAVALVEFYANGTFIANDTTSPYSVSWTPAGAGSYSLTAKAYDGFLVSTTTSAVNVTVAPTPKPVPPPSGGGGGGGGGAPSLCFVAALALLGVARRWLAADPEAAASALARSSAPLDMISCLLDGLVGGPTPAR